jgi:hypothetical protein
MFHTRVGKEKPLELIHHSAVILKSRVALRSIDYGWNHLGSFCDCT